MFYVLYLEQRRTQKNSNNNFSLWWWWGSIFYCSCCSEWKRHCQASSLARDLPFIHASYTFCDLMKLYYLVMNKQKNNLMLFPLHTILHFWWFTYYPSSIYVCMCVLFMSWKLSTLVYTQLQIGNIYGWFLCMGLHIKRFMSLQTLMKSPRILFYFLNFSFIAVTLQCITFSYC